VSPFPRELPVDLNDPAIIAAHDWQAFGQLKAMENHWDRPGWTDGRRSYHWMLSFHDTRDVQDLAKQCQAELPRGPLDPVPHDALHVTLGRIGFTDEISEACAISAAKQATSRCEALTPLALTIGPLAGSRGAIRFTVTPWPPLLELHRQLAAATSDVLGEKCVMDTEGFRPHLSIAYSNTVLPVAPLLPVMERLRQLAPVEVSVSSVLVVELRRVGRAYRYEEVAKVGMGGVFVIRHGDEQPPA
jgi:2'-5' RNA ligase